jgi:hypothetical protein
MKVYQNFNLCLQRVRISNAIIYFNPLVDVKTEPRLDIMPPIMPRPQIHQITLDTRWINDKSSYNQFKAVQRLLSQVWYFAKFDSVQLIIYEDKAHYIGMDMVQVALQEAYRNHKVDWKLVSERRYSKGSKTRMNHVLNVFECYLLSNLQFFFGPRIPAPL